MARSTIKYVRKSDKYVDGNNNGVYYRMELGERLKHMSKYSQCNRKPYYLTCPKPIKKQEATDDKTDSMEMES